MAKKKKVHTVAWHKKELWRWFTKFIKNRDGWQCFTCDKFATGWGMSGGHFITAATCPPSLYFDEDNVHAQCSYCNLNNEGNHYIYGLRLGKRRANRLINMRQKFRGEVWTIEEYLIKIAHYKKLVKEYENTLPRERRKGKDNQRSQQDLPTSDRNDRSEGQEGSI